ncbi:iron ABC transporter permease [Deferribacter autotrophicus]|uniref:Iron ABC transporter permease n=1 Tax=Deferribacter autotrophicus TaxID=500465 RepID=A0A5A8F046_9BACT|nr:iron ABC transporter permease [Deferribacter autotrophicus]KAA0257033.1 iron ABC transporter permease [Deferribacter autotrophicus]
MHRFEGKIKRFKLTFFALIFIFITLIIILISLKYGGNLLKIKEIFQEENKLLIFHLRLPRILADFMVGAGLSVVGFSFQTIVRNPLADPYLFGISGAAAFGYIFGVIFFGNFIVGSYLLSIIISITTVIFVLYLGTKKHEIGISSLILTGVAVSFFFSAVIAVMSVFLSDRFVKNILLWYMGNTGGLTLNESVFSLFIIVLLSFFMFLDMDKLNICRIGESFAQTTGVDVRNLIYRQYILGSMITVAVVSKCGAIGFVGLVMPHIVRLIMKTDYKMQYLMTFFIGGNMLIVLDTVIKTIFYPVEIPVGVITALLGSPFLIILLRKHRSDIN